MTRKRLWAAWVASVLAFPAAACAGTLYIAELGADKVEQFNLSGGAGSIFAAQAEPIAVATDRSGNVYAVSYGAEQAGEYPGELHKYSPAGTDLGALILEAANGQQPYGLVLDKSGNIYVSSSSLNYVWKYDSTGAYAGVLFGSGDLNGPRGLAVNSSGDLFVSENGGNIIREFDSSGQPVGSGTFASSGLNAPYALAFDRSGNLYAANYGNSTISEYDAFGNPVGSGIFAAAAAGSNLSRPIGLAFDALGNLYVSNQGNNTIEKFGPGGADLGTFASGLSDTWYIAISDPVPEPISLIFFGTGLVAVGGFVARRRMHVKA